MIARFRVFGRVQNVGYRHFVITKSRITGIRGYVKNCSDGSVEIYLNGRRDNITTMYYFCLDGPTFARVDKIETEYNVAFPTDTSTYYDF